jgi:acyl-CoA thioesterase
MQSLSQILAAFAAQDRVYRAVIDTTWLQGRTLFGGVIAALANHAMRQCILSDRPLRALQAVFVGPNAAGEVSFEPTILRAGKAVTLASCSAKSAGEVSLTITAMYGAPRTSMLNTQPAPVIIGSQPEQLDDVPLLSGLPSFTQHYHQRWARGAAPYTRATDSHMSVYVRYRGENCTRTSETHALALMDAIPSPALAMLETPGPASTLSWTLDILDHSFDFDIDEWWRLDAMVDAAADGYVTHTSHVVNPAGRVAAISRQVVVVYS